MITVYEFLRSERPAVLTLAMTALFTLIAALVVASFSYREEVSQQGAASVAIAVLLALTMIISIVLMVYTTWAVIRSRLRIYSWGWYLAAIWIFPYVAISVYLGGSEALRLLGRSKQRKRSKGSIF